MTRLIRHNHLKGLHDFRFLNNRTLLIHGDREGCVDCLLYDVRAGNFSAELRIWDKKTGNRVLVKDDDVDDYTWFDWNGKLALLTIIGVTF